MLRYSGTTMGEVVIKQDDHKFKIQIRSANCIAALIHIKKITEGENKGKYLHTLYSFFANEQHLKNMLKEQGRVIYNEVVSISLNLYFKECWTMLKYFVKSGYKVKCYHKKITEDTK